MRPQLSRRSCIGYGQTVAEIAAIALHESWDVSNDRSIAGPGLVNPLVRLKPASSWVAPSILASAGRPLS